MLGQLLEAALRSFTLGGAVWLSLMVLRVRNPQARMTAWTVVLMASLSMPVLMHWATIPIPALPANAVVAPVFSAAEKESTAQPKELPPETTASPSAADNRSPSASEDRGAAGRA